MKINNLAFLSYQNFLCKVNYWHGRTNKLIWVWEMFYNWPSWVIKMKFDNKCDKEKQIFKNTSIYNNFNKILHN